MTDYDPDGNVVGRAVDQAYRAGYAEGHSDGYDAGASDGHDAVADMRENHRNLVDKVIFLSRENDKLRARLYRIQEVLNNDD